MKRILSVVVTSFVACFVLLSTVKAYIVLPGDWLSKIAYNHGTTVGEILDLNPYIENPDLIFAWESIILPEELDIREENLGATLPVAGVNYTLSGSGITGSVTSITLQSLTIPQTGYELLDSDFSDTFYITLEPGSRTRQEIVSCTTVTQNANNTATLSGCSRGLLPFTPFTASTTYQFSHAGGTTVIFSDPPQLFNEFTAKSNQEIITRPWSFEQYPTASSSLGNATTSRQLITLGQANSIGNQGAATSTEDLGGICELATQDEMASSTDLGADRPLCLQARYATSTPSAAPLNNFIVITENDKRINQGFLDLTETWAFSTTGTVTFGGVGLQASSTANSVPISQNNGTIEPRYLPVETRADLLSVTSTDGGITGSAAATGTLFATTTVPGGLMGTTGTIHIHVDIDNFSLADGNGSTAGYITSTLMMNGTRAISATLWNPYTPTVAGLRGKIDAYIYNITPTTQEVSLEFIAYTNQVGKSQSSSTMMINYSFGTASIDTRSDWTFEVLSLVGASSANIITSGRGYSEIILNRRD